MCESIRSPREVNSFNDTTTLAILTTLEVEGSINSTVLLDVLNSYRNLSYTVKRFGMLALNVSSIWVIARTFKVWHNIGPSNP